MTLTDRGIPTDVVEEILNCLDFLSIMKCRAVCSTFRDLIDSSPKYYWKMELAVAGKEDGGNHQLPLRREMLQNHQQGWDSLHWTEERRWKHMRGGLWELYGNVLSQCSTDGSIFHFKRLPSLSRDIEEKNWAVDVRDLEVDDFCIDPAQDLLVIVEEPHRDQQGDRICRVFLWALSTGDPHPCVAGNHPLMYTSPNTRIREKPWPILICGDTLAILFDNIDLSESEIMLWNWKTGKVLAHIVSGNLKSVAFLSKKYIMLALLQTPTEPRIIVIDFIAEPPERRHLADVDRSCTFHFPPIAGTIVVTDIDLRSDPAPDWKPDPTSSVPFFTGKDRLYVISLFITNNEESDQVIQLYALDHSFLSPMEAVVPGQDNQNFDWNLWGPNSTRWIGPQIPSSGWYTRYIYGTKYVSTMQPRGRPVDYIYLYDFNQLALRWGKMNAESDCGGAGIESGVGDDVRGGKDEGSLLDVTVTAPTKITGGKVFQGEVETQLAYRMKRWRIPGRPNVQSAMCNEDGIVMVYGDVWAEEFHILTV